MNEAEEDMDTPVNRGLAEGLDERLFDLLVDGELGQAEQRELFARLDARPEHWRRLALAFVEAQSWRRDLGALASPRRASTSTLENENASVESAETRLSLNEPTPASSGPVRGLGWTQSILTLAACVLCAFFLGGEARNLLWPARPNEPARVGPVAEPAVSRLPSVARGPEKSGDAMPEARLVSSDGLVGSLTLEEPRTESSRGALELPVLQGEDFEKWVRNQPSAISSQMREALEARGHQVQVERQFVPFTLEDGRQVIVPVEQVEVRAARRAYQ